MFLLLVVTLDAQAEECWVPSPFASFPFTSPTARFHVPSDPESSITLDGLFRVKLKTADYPHHSPLSPSLLLPCVTVCHQIPFTLYLVDRFLSTAVLRIINWKNNCLKLAHQRCSLPFSKGSFIVLVQRIQPTVRTPVGVAAGSGKGVREKRGFCIRQILRPRQEFSNVYL